MTELWHDAFLLHQRPYGNTSIMAEMFTLENGRISVIARGAKKPKSKFFGVLSPFSKLRITYRGRSELKTLTNVDKEDIFSNGMIIYLLGVRHVSHALLLLRLKEYVKTFR